MEDHVEVARPFDDIKDIDETKDVWTLAVRIVDLWSVISKYKSEHVEMVIMDEKSSKIQLTLPKEFMSEFKEILHHNKTYEMENFKVSNNDIVVKGSNHPYRLTATGATNITQQDFPNIPMATLNFKDFGDVIAGKYRTDLIVDAIGAFQEVTNTNKSGSNLRSITFLLKDASANFLHCCLWDDYAKKFYDMLSRSNGTNPVIVVIKHARVKPEQGNYPLCFTNTWDGTQVLFNPDLPEVNEFKTKFEALPNNDVGPSQNPSQFSQGSTPLDIMSRATFLSLADINQIQKETVCVTVAEITKLNATRYGWTYDGCKECTKVLKMDNGKLKCRDGHVNEKPIPRYKVEVQAVHKKDKARFLFWDTDCASILKISAANLREQMIQAGHTNPRTYPKLLDKLICKKKIFKVKATPGPNPCSIIQISDSEQLLTNLEKQFGLEEETTSKEPIAFESVSEGKEPTIIASQSLCGENDPSLTLSTPPAKRLSLDEIDSFAIQPSITSSVAQHVQPTQLSSTKLVKNPKNAKTPKLEK